MYDKLYKQASQAADLILQGGYQRRGSERVSIVTKPPMLGNKGNSTSMDVAQDEDPMMDYLVAVKQQNAQLQEMLMQQASQVGEMAGADGGGGPRAPLGEASGTASKGYDMSQKEIEAVIRTEAAARNIDPDIAVRIFRAEGAGSYQSQIARSGKGSAGGKEASYGPYQLYTGGGLGNQYEKATGRSLPNDNTADGVVNQVRFALDAAVESGWTPWYGRGPAGVGEREGLQGAKKVGNWG